MTKDVQDLNHPGYPGLTDNIQDWSSSSTYVRVDILDIQTNLPPYMLTALISWTHLHLLIHRIDSSAVRNWFMKYQFLTAHPIHTNFRIAELRFLKRFKVGF